MAVPIIEDYEIANNIGYFVLDNASSNNTCMKAILKNLLSRFDIQPENREAIPI